MRRRVVLIPWVLLLATTSCVPVLVGGLIYKSSTSREQKQEFMAQLQRTNTDREARGLRALDWCSEAYRFDKGWAWDDPNCRTRIQRYEEGDQTALDPPGSAQSGANAPADTASA